MTRYNIANSSKVIPKVTKPSKSSAMKPAIAKNAIGIIPMITYQLPNR
ncbi:MAG: hypothetical protein ACM3X1_09885 [Ignavibacteriales bacterium]